MPRCSIRQVRFSSYLALCCYVSLSWGATTGFALFVGTFMNDALHARIAPILDGSMSVATATLVVVPVIFLVAGFVMGMLSFLPFRMFTRMTDGICIHSDREVELESFDVESARMLRRLQRQ